MLDVITYLWQYIVQSIGLFIAYACAAVLIYLLLRRLHSIKITLVLVAVFLGASISFYVPNGIPHAFQYPFFLTTYGPSTGPILPFANVLSFITNFTHFKHVPEIARDPNDVPEPIERTEPSTVEIELTSKEVIGEMADGVTFNYWTFDGTVPGPLLRVREGDTVVLTLHNDETSLHHHSIDLHAVTGPGGGAAATIVAPGESKTITFKALKSGVYVYHCAHPNVANHMAHGMYGLIVVDPIAPLPRVDHEFYVMQGEFYSAGALGRKGLQLFDAEAMLDGKPQYIVFNGSTGALVDNMQMKVGESARIYIGNGGVNLISSFHLIGEIFDKVYREGDFISPPALGIQTTLIPAGGAAAVEFTADYPGKYILVDHALARLDRGAWGVIEVTGEKNSTVFEGDIQSGMGH